MEENIFDAFSIESPDYYLPWYNLGCVDPGTRRVPRPSQCTDNVEFYDRLIYEAYLFMEREGEIGLCLFEQAYEVARDSKELGPTECYLAAEELNRRGFSELAYKLFDEIAEKALNEKDMKTLDNLLYSLWQCGGFASNKAKTLADHILNKHPELLPTETKKKRSN